MLGNRKWWYWVFAGAFVLSLVLPLTAQQSTISKEMGVHHWSGQSVSPVYEGFDINKDGTYNLWFGYMNENFAEELDIPVGANNTMDPGGDRGQPTHFASRRHKDVFKVVVPKDFGDKKVVWTLKRGTESESVAGTLNPVWQVDRRFTTRGGNDDAVDSNTPPVVALEQLTQTVMLNAKATINVRATDDGLPKRRRNIVQKEFDPTLYAVPTPPPARGEGGGRAGRGAAPGAPGQEGPGLSFAWYKYRGPGKVTFDPREGMFVAGRASTNAAFDKPGEYVIQVVVDDGSGESAGNFGYHCCWTNAETKITVQGASR